MSAEASRPLAIAVLSDTHNHLPDPVVDGIASADEIWHLGDVCRPDTLRVLESIGSPRYIVQGNCDPYFHWQSKLRLERNGKIFQLQHLPPREASNDLTALLFGHLHYPVRQWIDGVWTLNPGAITGPRNQTPSSFAWLRIAANGDWNWDVETL